MSPTKKLINNFFDQDIEQWDFEDFYTRYTNNFPGVKIATVLRVYRDELKSISNRTNNSNTKRIGKLLKKAV